MLTITIFIIIPIIVVVFCISWILKKEETEGSESKKEITNWENNNIREKSFLKFVFDKNKKIWLRSFPILLCTIILFFLLKNYVAFMPFGLGGILLAPFVFIVIGILGTVLVKLVSSISIFYFPNQIEFKNSEYFKYIFIVIVILYFVYQYFFRKFF